MKQIAVLRSFVAQERVSAN